MHKESSEFVNHCGFHLLIEVCKFQAWNKSWVSEKVQLCNRCHDGTIAFLQVLQFFGIPKTHVFTFIAAVAARHFEFAFFFEQAMVKGVRQVMAQPKMQTLRLNLLMSA